MRTFITHLSGMLLLFCLGCQSKTEPLQQPVETASDSPYSITVDAALDNSRLVTVVVTVNDEELLRKIQAEKTGVKSFLSLSLASTKISNTEKISILGEYSIEGNRCEFIPAFPLVHGEKYIAQFDASSLNPAFPPIEEIHIVAKTETGHPPKIVGIYPSGNKLPANHLKFYILFSEEMQQGDIFPYFSLFNVTKNKQVLRPFRHTELWSADGKQLTLWFHPGRQKVGVNLNVELDPILIPGDEYVLEISNEWQSLAGETFLQPIQKKFQVIASDLVQPDITNWQEQLPHAKTDSPYLCTFPAPLDWALLQNKLMILNSQGEPVKGRIKTSANETTWQFIPKQLWQTGKYYLVVDPLLEDLAGNSLSRPFAVDATKQKQPQSTTKKKFRRQFLLTLPATQ